ncbi:serine/threonine protein kinase [Mycobacterium kyorinense]|uniref:non-specific serine/threonine protein kinase n=2 Tax=Mycobacterium kyorinense TaxID=487514 RepID=A0A1A2Z6X5_9MYCO|nr:serine/threonine protein kinase [Mycobacterium kyorinense]
MGAVYLAANPTLPRFDALKVLSPELSRDPDFRARFTREADVAAALQHPQIVSVYNRGHTDDGQLWIAMQFVDGTDADDALRAGTMTPQRAVHIITEVAKALDFAHQRHVVHRDVKPANFLLSGPVGVQEQVLLGDFGIARALDDVGLTATGSVMATIAYAAPEVLSTSRFDGRADIYSLGCTLFRLLTGKPPFSGRNGPAAVMLAHLQQPPPRVTDLVPGLPPALDYVIATAMAKDPGARFATASDLAHAAAAALRDPTLRLRAPMPAVPTTDVVSYPQMQGSDSAPWWQNEAPRTMGTPAAPPPAPQRRRRTVIGAGIGAAALVVATAVAVAVWPDAADSTPRGPAAQSNPTPALSSVPAPSFQSAATDIAPDQLRSILLTAAELPQSGGAPMALEQDTTGLADDAGTVAPADQQCLNAWAPAQQSVYHATRSAPNVVVTGAAIQTLRGLNQKPWQDGLVQAVVSFATENSANGFYVRQRGAVELCGGKTITVLPSGSPPQTWEFTHPVTTTGVYTVTATLHGENGTCQHGIMPRGNVMIDIRQCRAGGGADVAALVLATAAKVPHQ